MTGFAPSWSSFSTVYCETLPLPDTRQILPSKRFLASLQHLFREVHAAVAGGFRTNQRAAPVQAFAGQHAGELVADAFVLAEHVADLASAHADVAGGNVGVRADVAAQLGHEALAEAHHFVVALALGIEVGSALAAAHGQRGQRVLEDLLKSQELQDAEIDRGMEAQAALVGADGAVHLDTEAAIDLDIVLVVKPRHTEHDEALGFSDALKNFCRDVFRMPLQHGAQRLEYFLHRLMKFRLGGVLGLYQRHDFVDVVGRCFDAGRGNSSTHRWSSSNLLLFRADTEIKPFVHRRANLIEAEIISVLGKQSGSDCYHPEG